MDWYYVRNQRETGPVAEAEFRRLVTRGEISGDTLVWNPGMRDWTALADVPGMPAAAPAPSARTARQPGPGARPAAAAAPARSAGVSGYIADHWRGRHSLARSYWVNTVLLSLPFNLLFSGLQQADIAERHAYTLVHGYLAALGAALLITVWQTVGTWRAAGRHVRDSGRRFWAGATRVVLVLSILFLAANLAVLSPTLTELVRIALGVDGMSDYRVFASQDGSRLQVEGTLGFGVTRKLRQLAEQHPQAQVLVLNSRGGRIGEAHALKDFLQQSSIRSVRAEGLCHSACIIAFMALRDRVLDKDATLGFHRYAFPGLGDADFEEQIARDKGYLASQGVDRGFLERAYATPAESMWVPDPVTLLRAGAIAAVMDGERRLDLDGYAELHAGRLQTELLKLRVYQVIRQYAPAEFSAMREQMARAVAQGLGDEQAVMQVRGVIPRLVDRFVPHASDEALSEYIRITVQELEELLQKDPALCFSFLFPQPGESLSMAEHVSKPVLEADLAALAEVIESAALSPQPLPTPAAVQPVLGAVYARVEQRHGSGIANLPDPARSGLSKAQTCQAVIDIYSDIARYPLAERARSLRFMLANSGA